MVWRSIQGLAIIFLMAGFSPTLWANTVYVPGDPKLDKLKEALPEGWFMAFSGDTMIIENSEPVWVLRSNFINAPAQDMLRDDANREKITENGVATQARFFFLLKEKKLLTDAEFAQAHYFSKHYALFELSATGFDTPYARHYPYDIEEQASSIYYLLLGQNLKPGLGPVYANVDYSRP